MNGSGRIKALVADPEALRIEWHDGAASEFASIWPRDNRPEDRDPHSGQRLIDIADLPAQPRIRSAETHEDRVSIRWDDGRTAFSSARHGRHLHRCYLTRDSVYSTTALLRRAIGQK